jgi:hypothetical protein
MAAVIRLRGTWGFGNVVWEPAAKRRDQQGILCERKERTFQCLPLSYATTLS